MKIEYPLIIPPKGTKPFEEMNEIEANKFLSWYVSMVPERIAFLKSIYYSSSNDDIFDFTKESLIPLWRWYIQNVGIEPKSMGEYRREKKALPRHLHEDILKDKILIEWIQVVTDIGIYFCECLTHESSNLSWGIVTTPRDILAKNMPIIIGFANDRVFDPYSIMNAQMRKILKKKSVDTDLYSVYLYWEKCI